jgi:hypothetical protein
MTGPDQIGGHSTPSATRPAHNPNAGRDSFAAPVNDRAGQPANRDALPAGQSVSSFHGGHHA